jgi:large subunit ribosomal protein L15
MPLVRRVPKRGFTNIWRTEYTVVNLRQIGKLDPAALAGNDVTPEVLVARGLARSGRPLKVLGVGEVGRALKVKAHRFSKSARAKIEAAGGVCEELPA